MNRENNIYWGDIHNHCGISYGNGKLEDAIARAKQQLDFCSVTGHAFWHDIPLDNKKLSDTVEYHIKGFDKLKKNWEYVQKTISNNNDELNFLTFLSYEWHSSKYGDHAIYYLKNSGPLLTANNPKNLGEKISSLGGIIVPHHTAYRSGFRGFDWTQFSEKFSPVVEIYSMHGCSESDLSPFPYLHVMGPKDSRGTTAYGLSKGYKFGFSASSDQHYAYPGSWGDGRIAVYAPRLTKKAIWESILKKKTYAVTGDKIKVFFEINGGGPGEILEIGNKREINIDLETEDFLDRIELIKNGKVIKYITDIDNEKYFKKNKKVKLRVEWGWGLENKETKWQGKIKITNGEILSVEPCFRGRPILGTEKYETEEISLPHKIYYVDKKLCEWISTTIRNPTTLHSATQSLILKINIEAGCKIKLDVNGYEQEIPLESLLKGSQSFYPEKYISSEAVRIHRAVSENIYKFKFRFYDEKPEQEIDYYYLRIAQRNNQWAWVTPVWVIS